jgi:hypothetical protein
MCLAAGLLCSPLTVRAGSDADHYQAGLYQLLTVGDVEKALASFKRAEQQRSTQTGLEEILLQQLTCLEWAGRDEQLQELIDRIGQTVQAPALDLGPSRLLPLDADAILHLDLTRLRKAPIWAQLRRNWSAADSMLFKRSRRVALAVSLPEGTAARGARFLVVVEGNFAGIQDADVGRELTSLLTGPLASAVSHLADGAAAVGRPGAFLGTGIQMIGVDLPQGPAHLGLARADDGLLLLGDPGRIASALAVLRGRRLGLGADPRARTLRNRLPIDAASWLLVAPGEILRRLAELQGSLGLAAHLPSLSGILISVQTRRGMEVQAKAWTVDSESARILADLARGALALASLGAQSAGRTAMAELLQSLQVSSSGSEVGAFTTLDAKRLRSVFPFAVTKP